MEKLFVITRRDLSAGAQAVQSCHAALQFVTEHPKIWARWSEDSNYLVLLSVSNQRELEQLIDQACQNGLAFSAFFEPDFDNALTAIALEPQAKWLCKGLGLTLAVTPEDWTKLL